MPEQWSCGNCPLVVEIPNEQTNHEGYIDTILLIREHRFGHIADAFMTGPEAVMGLLEDKPSGYDPYHQPVTSDDVAPAVEMAEAIVRGA